MHNVSKRGHVLLFCIRGCEPSGSTPSCCNSYPTAFITWLHFRHQRTMTYLIWFSLIFFLIILSGTQHHMVIYFKVLGREDTSQMYGHPFIPLIEIPNVYYVTVNKGNLMMDLIISCLQMWPLMIMCALMVIISGFICWCMETWNNENEFPRTFLSGWFEGIWWSFISMTTVGIGFTVVFLRASKFAAFLPNIP